MVALHGSVVGDNCVIDAATPSAGAFETGPMPVRYTMTMLPVFAGLAAPLTE